MATQQDAGGVPFAIAHDFKQFRLLELPPELVELLDAPNPPQLTLKSHDPSVDHGTPAYAVLCTPSKSFQLRQVQTSNSLFVTQPALAAHDNNDLPVPVTCAIAACATTLEVLPSTADNNAVTALKKTLQTYDIVGGEVDATNNGRNKASIFEHLPASQAECETAWKHLVAFELDGSSYQPSSNALAQVWRSINAAALAEGIKVEKQFLTNDIVDAVVEEGHPFELVKAILAHLSVESTDNTGTWSCLDRTKTIMFTAKTLLESQPSKHFLIADFTDTWEDRLPDVWRKDAQLSAIEGLFDCPSNTTIRAKGGSAATVEDATTATKPSARKWHEKFGKTRKK